MNDKQLPPLPDPHIGLPWRHNAPDGSIHSSAFTAEQMREYALQAIAYATQQADVTDEQIIDIAAEWSNRDFANGAWRFCTDFARAILALRPAPCAGADDGCAGYLRGKRGI